MACVTPAARMSVLFLVLAILHAQLISGTPSTPEPPFLVSSTATSFLLGWTEPRDNASAITQYIISQETSSIIVDVANGAVLQVNISGLLPNTNYTFTLTAVSANGSSNESDPVTFQTPEVPSAPLDLTVSEFTPTSLSLEWGSPLQPNGVILWYEVRYTGLDTLNLVPPTFYKESVIVVNGSSLEVELVELVPYSLYNITVQAATEVGSGDVAVLTARTIESLPSPVLDVMVSVLPRVIDLFWSAPLHPNGELLAYNVTFNGEVTLNSVTEEFYDSVMFQVNVSDGPMTSLFDLEPFSNYTITLSAMNSAGEGNVTELSVMTPEDVPSAPSDLTVSEFTPTSLSLEWGPPLQPNGVILWYEVQYTGLDTLNLVPPTFYSESVIGVNGSFLEVELVELVPYSLYNITVRAATEVGSGDIAVLTARTKESPPSPVLDVMVSVLPRVIDLFWSPPLYPNGELLGYNVTFNGEVTLNSVTEEFYDSVMFQVNVSDGPMTSLFDLEPFSNYTIKLSAMNSAGEGNVTELSVMTPEDVPSAPSDLTVSEFTPTSLSLEWGSPLQPNGVILWYEVRYAGLDTLNLVPPTFYSESMIVVNGSFLEVELVELVPYSLYNITVQAATEVGSGDVAVLTARTNESPPSPVLDVMVSVLPRVIDLFWSAPLYPNGELLAYNVTFNGEVTLNSVTEEFYDSVMFQVNVSDGPMTSLFDLEPFSNYTIKLSAMNSAGEGNVTELSVMTPEDVPSAPSDLTVSEFTPTSLSLEWGSPLQPNGVILWYEVRYTGLDTLNLIPPTFYNESVIVVNGLSLEVELVELVPYSLYNITVRAATEVGSGDIAVLTARTNESPPSSVLDVMVSVLPRVIDLFWSAPLYPNGELLAYNVTFNGEVTLNSVTEEFYDSVMFQVNISDGPMTSLFDLEPFSNYTITLSAMNSAGEGNITELSVMTPEDVPSPVLDVMVSVLPRVIDLFWSAPLYPNGELLAYNVTFNGEVTLNSVTEEFYDSVMFQVNVSDGPMTSLFDLEPFSNYTIKLSAMNSAGEGNVTEISVMTPEDVSSPVLDVMVSVLPRVIDLFWSAPLYPNGELLAYNVTFNGEVTLNSVTEEFYDSVMFQVNVSDGPMTSLFDLEPFSNYTITLSAMNSAGEGNVTELSVMTPEDVPSPPVNLSIFNVTPTMFLIQWDPPTHPNGIILRYEVFYTGEDTLNDVPESFYNTTVVGLSPNTTSLELVELEPYSVYNITIRAVNGAGNGAFNSEMGLLTQTEPFLAELPSNLTEFDITINSFGVAWIEPLDPNGVIASYYVELTAIDGSLLQTHNVSNSTFNVTFYGLEPVIWYNVSLCAWTIGCGENFTIDVLTDGIAPNITRASDLYLMANLNEPFQLSFQVLDAAPNISEGVVWWTFTSSKGVMNLSCDPSSAHSFSADCLSLSIKEVQASDGGLYEIVAETRAGIGRSHVFVIVIGAPPSIVTPLPTNLSQTHMTNFTLVCSAVADLTAVIVWRYNGEMILKPDAVNRTHSILKIKSLTSSNSGIYNCSASNRYGRDSTAVNLQVQVPPTISNFPSKGRDVVLGDPLVITCMAEGTPPPLVVWYKGNISLDNITDGANTSTARLNIAEFEEDDEGYYSCIAENSIGLINESLRISIVERANITGISLNNEAGVVNDGSAGPVDEFQSLTLTCSATGKPTPSILWLRDGVTIGRSSGRTITSRNSTTGSGKLLTTSTLMVSQVMLADKGTYTCRAVSGNVSPIPGQTAWTFRLDVRPRNECVVWNPCNSVGTMQCVDGSNNYTCICKTVDFFSYFGKNCSMKRDIRRPPEVTKQPKDQLNTTISSMVVLFCEFDGIPAPVVRWFKDDIDTKVEGQYFTIGAIRPDDRGAYHCEAKNELANDKIGKAISQKAMVLIQGLVQFQVTLMTSAQNSRQLNIEEIKDVTEQLRLLAAGTMFTTPAAVSGSLHSVEVYESKSSTLLVTMVTKECCLPLQNFSSPFQMYLQQALQGYSDILKSTPFDVESVQRHDGCPVDVSQVKACSSIGPVTWPETEIGDTASISCPCGIMDPLIDKLMGNRTCGGSYTSGAEWMDPQCNECNFTETRNELCRLTQVDSPAQLALRLTNATNDTAQLEKEDVSASTVLLESVAYNDITDDFDADYVQLDMLTTMDHIAGVAAKEVLGSQEVSKSSTRVLNLVKAITKRANVSLNSSLEFIGAQLSLMVTEMSVNSTENGTDLSPLIADQIEKIINDQNATKRGTDEVPAASVYLPAGIFPSGNTSANSSRLALALYASDSLFQQRKNYTYSLYQDFAQVTGTIVSVSIVGEVINSGDLPDGEVVAFEFDKNEIGVQRGLNGKCAFWQFEDDDQYGGWNTSGCSVTMETNTSIHCQCDHLTHFCILMDIFPERSPSDPSSPELQEALTVISIIGAIVSIACFIIVSITYLANKTLRAEAHSRLLVNLCLSLTGLYLTFIISTMDEVIRIPPLCGTFGVMLHYFFLTTFFLMAADAALIYKKLVWVFKPDIPSYVAITGSIAWTLPVFLVAFSVAPNYKQYYNDKFCRAYGMPYYIGVLVPFGSIYVFNWVMFVLTLTALTKRPALDTINSSKYQKWRKNFWVTVCLSILFGLAWSLGLLASNGIPKAFSAIFECAFTFLLASQGILLLIIYCLTSPEVRKFWKQLLLRGCRCCGDGLKRGRAKSSSQPTQSSKLTDTLSTSKKNRPSDLSSPASPDSHTLSGYSTTATSTHRPSYNSKSEYLYSTVIVSDDSVVGNPPIAVMDSVHEEIHLRRLPKDRTTSSYVKRVNTGDIIELQPCTSETTPLIPAVAIGDKEPAPPGSPILVSVSEHSPDQTSAV